MWLVLMNNELNVYAHKTFVFLLIIRVLSYLKMIECGRKKRYACCSQFSCAFHKKIVLLVYLVCNYRNTFRCITLFYRMINGNVFPTHLFIYLFHVILACVGYLAAALIHVID